MYHQIYMISLIRAGSALRAENKNLLRLWTSFSEICPIISKPIRTFKQYNFKGKSVKNIADIEKKIKMDS